VSDIALYCSGHSLGRCDALSSIFADAHGSGAAYAGHLQLASSFAWLGTPSALTMLSVVALAEVLAHYVPVIDKLLDTLAAPAALIAGRSCQHLS
jgi:uncharacterized membrane protein